MSTSAPWTASIRERTNRSSSRGNAVYSSRRVHRLRRVRAGVSRRGDLRARRNAGKVDELHSGERAVFFRDVADEHFVATGCTRSVQGCGPCGCRSGSSEPFGLTCAAAAARGGSLALRADIGGDAELQFQLATLLFDENRVPGSAAAFDRAAQTDDPRWRCRPARARSVRRCGWPSSFAHARKRRS